LMLLLWGARAAVERAVARLVTSAAGRAAHRGGPGSGTWARAGR
jgi:hypothetical protein